MSGGLKEAALIEASDCKVVDPSIPYGWGMSANPHGGGYTIGPVAWQEPGFWELWMDRDSDARSAYVEFRSTTTAE